MIEFLWVLTLVASLVGALHCQPVPGTRWERLRRCVAQRWRWWLLVAALLLSATVYLWENVLRALLNLLLFFEHRAVAMRVLLAASLLGFILAWRNDLTPRRVVGGALFGAAVAFFLASQWYCLAMVLLLLTLFGLLLAQRDRLPRWLVWSSVLLTTVLATGLLLSRVLYDTPVMRFEGGDWLISGVVIVVSGLGWLWAWQAQAHLFAAGCGSLLVLFLGGLAWSLTGDDVPLRVAGAADEVLLFVLLAVAWSFLVWMRWLPMQPLGWVSVVMLLFLGSGLFFSSILYGEPEDFTDIEDQFKYGSIGSDHFMARGIPYYIWEILPERFPPETILAEILPEEVRETQKARYAPRYQANDPTGKGRSYEAFGLVKEADKKARLEGQDKDIPIDRPIGFSKRKVFGLDFVGINCAFCHVSTIRRDGSSPPQIVLGMPANTTDIELFFLFLFGAAEQEGFTLFTSYTLMNGILSKHPEMEFGRQVGQCGLGGICQEIRHSIQRFAYRLGLIPLTGLYARRLKHAFAFIDPHNPDRIPRFGPGRVDAWNPGKRTLVNPPLPVEYPGGIIDHTSIWNQKPRRGMRLHWDGNIDVLEERNIIAGLVVNGPNIECLDTKRLDRINNWIDGRPAPRFDDFVPPDQLQETYGETLVTRRERGRLIFYHWCAACHAEGGERIGRVEPLDGGGTHLPREDSAAAPLDTDPARMLTFTAELANALNTVGTDQWKLKSFKAQKGYVNMLLDGIWLRAPYLHNGSVPTLRDLLNKPCVGEDKPSCRPDTFLRGQDLYDWKRVGFKHEPTIESGDVLDITDRTAPPVTSFAVPPNGVVTVSGATVNVLGLTADEAGQAMLAEQEFQALVRQQNGPLDEEERKALRVKAHQTVIEEAEKMLQTEGKLPQQEAQEWARKQAPQITVKIHKKVPPRLFEFRTTLPGNSNRGHLYGTDLTAEEKDLLIEFLKTL